MEEKLTIKQARQLANITIREMAKKLEMSPTTYVNKENGTSRIYVDEAYRFCKIVGRPITSIFFESSVTDN